MTGGQTDSGIAVQPNTQDNLVTGTLYVPEDVWKQDGAGVVVTKLNQDADGTVAESPLVILHMGSGGHVSSLGKRAYSNSNAFRKQSYYDTMDGDACVLLTGEQTMYADGHVEVIDVQITEYETGDGFFYDGDNEKISQAFTPTRNITVSKIGIRLTRPLGGTPAGNMKMWIYASTTFLDAHANIGYIPTGSPLGYSEIIPLTPGLIPEWDADPPPDVYFDFIFSTPVSLTGSTIYCFVLDGVTIGAGSYMWTVSTEEAEGSGFLGRYREGIGWEAQTNVWRDNCNFKIYTIS